MSTELEQLRYPIGRFTYPETFDESAFKKHTDILRALPEWVELSIENLDQHQLHTPYRPEGWTVHQTVHHIADSHMNGLVRVKLALTEDNPTIKPYLESKWAELEDVVQLPVNISTTLLHSIHRKWVALLEHLTKEEIDRTYFHPEQQKKVTLWQMTALYAWHSRHHVAHIRNLRDRKGW